MTKHRAYDPSLRATIRLCLAGNRMVRLHAKTVKAEEAYLNAYRAKHGLPCIKEILDSSQPKGRKNEAED